MTFLIDINVLIALIDPSHAGHDAAHRWFAETGAASWATCPLTENGVVRIVGQGRVGVPIPEDEMEALRALERANCQAEPWPYLNEGDRVCIKGGALDGLVGVLCDSRKQARLMVSVSLLQRSVAIEVDRSQLVPLNMMANVTNVAVTRCAI